MPDATPEKPTPETDDSGSTAAKGPAPAPKRKRSLRRRMYVWLGYTFVLVTLALAGLHRYFSQPYRVAQLAEGILEKYTGGDAEVVAGSFTMDGVVRLSGVRLRVPDHEGTPSDLFTAQTVVIELDPVAVLTGDFTPLSITLDEPVLSVVENEDNHFNFEKLNPPLDTGKPGGMTRLPRFTMRDAWLIRGEVTDGQYHFLNRMHIEGDLTPDQSRGNTYRMAIRELSGSDTLISPSGEKVDPLEITGTLDMARMAVDGKMERLALNGPHASLLPRVIRKWWERLDPSGAIASVTFHHAGGREPSAEVKLDDVELTLAYLSDQGEYRTRMTGVTGSFRFNFDGIHPDLVGRIEGLKYHVSGTIKGYNADAPFDLSLQTAPFRIPEEPKYMVALPIGVQDVFKMLNPVGWLEVSMSLRRNLPGGKIEPSGTATVLTGRQLYGRLVEEDPDAAAKYTPNSPELVSRGFYHKFTYPFTNAHGLVTFDSEGVYVKALTGDTPNGGSATITGSVVPPSPDAAIDITVAAVNIPFDDVLFNALEEEERRGISQFFYEPGYRRLHQLGHYITHAEHAELEAERNDLAMQISKTSDLDVTKLAGLRGRLGQVEQKMKLPVFELGGKGNAMVSVTRPAGEKKFRIDVAIDIHDADVVVEYFPYPVRLRKGRLVLTREKFTFDAMQFDGLHGGRGALSGWVDHHHGEDTPIEPHLMLTYAEGPVDKLLFDTLGPPADDWIADLHPVGNISLAGKIFREPDKDIDIDVDVDVTGLSITPGGGAFTISDVKGMLNLHRGSVAFDNLTGRRGDSRINLTGRVDYKDSDKTTLTLNAKAYDLDFRDPVLDLVSSAVDSEDGVRKFWAAHEPVGKFDAIVDYKTVKGQPRQYKLDLRPDALSFIYEGARISLADTTGSIVLQPNLVTLDKFGGKFAAGTMRVNGPVTLDPLEAHVAVTATGTQIDADARHILPKSLVNVIDAMGFTAGYDVDMPTFVWRPDATEGVRTEAKATVKLTDAACKVGLPVTQLNGTLTLQSTTTVGADWPRLKLDLDAESLMASGRRVEDVKMRLLNIDGSDDRLIIPNLQGRVAGGRIGGIGAVELDSGEYQVQLELVDAELTRLTTPADPDHSLAERPANAPVPAPAKPDAVALTGDVSASFDITGSWKRDNAPILGRGDLIVRNANLNGVPLAMGLLKVTHLALPTRDRFERAMLSFFLRKDGVHFENIALMAKQMTISGRGSMNADGKLDLTLTTSNPNRLQLGPLSDIIDGVRNELATIRITGTLDNPDTKVQQFDGVRKAWIDIFGGNAKTDKK
ncbi:MAG: hypothetical protein GC159_09795 [Phycisphaera sp.]|nr:hypothetical protein [Phycisphaera sp.]